MKTIFLFFLSLNTSFNYVVIQGIKQQHSLLGHPIKADFLHEAYVSFLNPNLIFIIPCLVSLVLYFFVSEMLKMTGKN